MLDRLPLLRRSLGSLLTGENLGFLEETRARFLREPSTVDPSWHLALAFLEQLDVSDTGSVLESCIRRRGHRVAHLDPLAPARTLEAACSAVRELCGTLSDVHMPQHLVEVYCGGLGIETEHFDCENLRQWVFQAAENYSMEAEDWPEFARVIIRATEFERLMGAKFTGKKRFGAEGAEGIVLLLRRVLWRLADRGVKTAVIGTMHRGRLNLLTNAFGRPLEATLSEFNGTHPFGDGTAADVPYHLGWSGRVALPGGRSIEVDLLPNPSHLEAVNPIVLGKAKGLQSFGDPREVVAVLLHTDAAVIGQGSVAEIAQLANLDGFSTGGTIHIVINNRIGFTTEPSEARSSRYCTGVWKATDTLILHVNGEDVFSTVKAADMAVDFRGTHSRDAVIDFVCYRRNGHNEMDEPRFTQPTLYTRIGSHPPLARQFLAALEARGLFNAQDAERTRIQYEEYFQSAYVVACNDRKPHCKPRPPADDLHEGVATGLSAERVDSLIEQLADPPAGIKIDPKTERLIRSRREAVRSGITWSLAEALAIASLVEDDVDVRLTGQDVVRGAFSHRHFAPCDVETGVRALQIGHLGTTQAKFQVYNSPLSEYSVLGFEFGYSLARPGALTVWEAQFGDFANGAQIIIDQFVAAAEEKWGVQSPITILLPHGLEGQGPEHSSGRIERFLQLSEPRNFDIALPTTPANYFHLLRLQALGSAMRPLVIFSAKSLIRHPEALSSSVEFDAGARFKPVIVNKRDPTEHLIFCCGKIALDLEAFSRDQRTSGVEIIRIEQLVPFPEIEISELLAISPNARLTFVQEEPRNMGAGAFVVPRLTSLHKAGGRSGEVRLVSRPPSGSPAGSFHGRHVTDQAILIAEAFRSV